MKQTKWKKLSSKILLEHPRETVYEDEVELPNGLKTTYIHFGSHHHAAEVIAINDEGKILVQREYSYPPNEWLYQFPGGAINDGESEQEGALREFAEEANLTGTLEKIGWFYVDNRRRKDTFGVFIARDLSDRFAEKDPEEEIENYWFTEAEIDQMIRDGEFLNYSALTAWAFYKAHKK